MGQLIFQATLGGQVALVGPNTSSSFSLNVPAVNGNLVTTGDTGTVTNTMLVNSSVTIGSTAVSLGSTVTSFTGLTGLSSSSITDTGLTSGRVTYAGASGLLSDSAGLTYNGASLTISSGASASALIATSTSSGGTALNIQNNGTVNALIGGYLSCIGSGSATDVAIAAYQGALAFATNGANERMRIESGGNVGIGLSSIATGVAQRTLQIDNGSGGMILLGGANTQNPNPRIFGGSTYDLNLAAGVTTGKMIFYTNDLERMRIDSSGNLLVGTTGLGTIGSSSGSTITASGAIYSASTGESIFSRRSSDGDVILFRRDTSSVGSIAVTTLLTTYNTTSDYRLKTVTGSVMGQGERIDALEPIEYTWNSNGLRTRGFLAHKFQEVYANSVTGTKDGVDANG
ncbi:Intramolecular chaperone auto-processing domain containing protein, partial [uncultured Caudovirales phage]